ncbi:MAG: TrmH family RNA methyltransferase [Flavobacteriales bacterium]|nr:TrmH family RNA methyltransferase [Flavobacteriales bacterium]
MPRRVKVILDNVRSHHNVGSVFRTADAFGMDEIILVGITPRPPHRDIHKTALGATESVAWRHFESSSEILEELRDAGFKIVSIEQHGSAIELPEAGSIGSDTLAIVLGNEVQGVSNDWLENSDEIWEIEQKGIKKSLNVSVCAGIVMHHLSHS